MTDATGFVADGAQRYYAVLHPVIRAEVLEDYAERLANARPMARWTLRLRMAREVSRRIQRAMSPAALY
jgi:hypothetical protein